MEKQTRTSLLEEAIKVIAKRKIITLAASNHHRKAVKCMDRLAEQYREMAEVETLYRGGDIDKDYWLKETDRIYRQIRRIIKGFDTNEIMAKEYVKRQVTGSKEISFDYDPEKDPDILLIKKVCGIN